MQPESGTYPIDIAGIRRELKLFTVRPGLKIAILNILGDVELVAASAKALAVKLGDLPYDVIVTAEAKSIPLAYALAVETKKPYVVLRKEYKSYMGDVIQCETLSITTGKTQTLYLDEKDKQLVGRSQVLIVDDVISTGSTLQAMEKILSLAGAKVVGKAAILTEGESAEWSSIISLGHLPLFTDEVA